LLKTNLDGEGQWIGTHIVKEWPVLCMHQSVQSLVKRQMRLKTSSPEWLDFARKKCEHFNLQVDITHS
jgi:hypothetical protein